jgi:hypothetical protein
MSTKVISLLILISVLFSCKKETETDPRVETTIAKSIAAYICYTKATVPEKGSYGMVDYGFVYSTSSGNFGIENGLPKISLGTIPMVADTFSTSFSVGSNGYGYSETFYVRAYYTNKKGTVYGSALSFKPLVLSINSVQPKSGNAGDKITITGNNFSKNPEDNIVKFYNSVAKVIEATSTKLVVEVPTGVSSDSYYSSIPIYITVGGVTLNWSGFTLSPVITGFSPSSGTFGTIVNFTGSNLYEAQIKLNNVAYYTNYNNNNSIQISIPNDIKTSKISMSVVKNGVETVVPGEFTMIPCSITSVLPQKGQIGSQLVISGIGFNPNSYSNVIKIGGVNVANFWNNGTNTITITVPESLKPGTYDVTVNNGITDVILPKAFTVMEPKITGFSPTSGSYNSVVTIFGENLVNVQSVGIGNSGAPIVSRDSLQIVVNVPPNTSTGKAKIWANVGNKTIYSSEDFTVLSPVITSFSPAEGTPGTIVTIKGNGFDSVQYNTTVKFGTIASTVVSVSPTEIKAIVPSNVAAGVMKLLVVTPWYTIATDTDFTVKK